MKREKKTADRDGMKREGKKGLEKRYRIPT